MAVAARTPAQRDARRGLRALSPSPRAAHTLRTRVWTVPVTTLGRACLVGSRLNTCVVRRFELNVNRGQRPPLAPSGVHEHEHGTPPLRCRVGVWGAWALFCCPRWLQSTCLRSQLCAMATPGRRLPPWKFACSTTVRCVHGHRVAASLLLEVRGVTGSSSGHTRWLEACTHSVRR